MNGAAGSIACEDLDGPHIQESRWRKGGMVGSGRWATRRWFGGPDAGGGAADKASCAIVERPEVRQEGSAEIRSAGGWEERYVRNGVRRLKSRPFESSASRLA